MLWGDAEEGEVSLSDTHDVVERDHVSRLRRDARSRGTQPRCIRIELEQLLKVISHARPLNRREGFFLPSFFNKKKKLSAKGPNSPAMFHFAAVVRM